MFIRYPGAKAKLRDKILRAFPTDHDPEMRLWHSLADCYCEPFFGSGAIGWDLLRMYASKKRRAVINDIDSGLAALWAAVRDAPQELERHVVRFEPSAEAFYQFKADDGAEGIDPVRRGFQKLALHQMSFSGLGAMSGGPLGGRNGQSKYNPRCRWSPGRITERLWLCHHVMHRFARFDVFCTDFADILADIPCTAFVYLDPPYYKQGPALYKHAFSVSDHARLAASLRHARFRWVLSYDDQDHVRELYKGWTDIEDIEMTPTMQTARGPRRKNREIVIRNRGW